MEREGYEPQEETKYSKEELMDKVSKAYGDLKVAEARLQESNGREEYTKNIRARDEAKKEYEKWQSMPVEMSLEELKHELEKAEREFKSSPDQKTYELAMRRIDTLQKQIKEMEQE